MQLSRSSNNVSYLASAVCGSGIPVNRIQQLFLISFLTGKKDPHQLAEYAHSLLLMQGQKIIKDGIEVQSDKETLEELIAQAVSFAHRDIPILKQLQII